MTGVSSMLEDRMARCGWERSSDGILKFDRARQRFTRYRNDPANIESLSENRITTLFEDREGHIWTGFGATEPGFFLTRALPFTKLPFDAHNPNNLGETLVNVIYEDRHGILWMGTTGALNRFDRKSGQLTHLDVPGNGDRERCPVTRRGSISRGNVDRHWRSGTVSARYHDRPHAGVSS